MRSPVQNCVGLNKMYLEFTLKLSVLFLSSAESYETDTQLGEVLHTPTNAKNGPDTTCIYVTKSSALISSFPFCKKHRKDPG